MCGLRRGAYPNRMALLLNMSPRTLSAILSYTCYYVFSVDEQVQQTALERISLEIDKIQKKCSKTSAIGSLPSQRDHSQALAATPSATAMTAVLDVGEQPVALLSEAEIC